MNRAPAPAVKKRTISANTKFDPLGEDNIQAMMFDGWIHAGRPYFLYNININSIS